MKITNTSKTPAGVHTHRGLVFLEPDETAEYEVTGAELESAKMAGLLEFDGEPSEPGKATAKGKATKVSVVKQADGKFSVVRGDDTLAKDLVDEAAAKAWIADPANKA